MYGCHARDVSRHRSLQRGQRGSREGGNPGIETLTCWANVASVRCLSRSCADVTPWRKLHSNHGQVE